MGLGPRFIRNCWFATPSDGAIVQFRLSSCKACCRVGSVLERAKVALSRLSLVLAMLQTSPMLRHPGEVGVGSAEDMRADLYGCFSPRPSCLGQLPIHVATPAAVPTLLR